MTQLTYDEFIKDSELFRMSPFQNMYVIIKGKEYKITDWWPDCDPVVDHTDPDLREETNHRIIFEVEI